MTRMLHSYIRVVLLALCLITMAPADSKAGDAETIVMLLNSEFGNVCSAELEGWFSDTLRIDWTSQTTVLTSAVVLSNISDVKEMLYEDGVRYLKIPNDAGGYNVFDWKTGDRWSVDESAPYYFAQ